MWPQWDIETEGDKINPGWDIWEVFIEEEYFIQRGHLKVFSIQLKDKQELWRGGEEISLVTKARQCEDDLIVRMHKKRLMLISLEYQDVLTDLF